jgi:uncharacterized membrane protein YphA (DoxX/SURF4 family)
LCHNYHQTTWPVERNIGAAFAPLSEHTKRALSGFFISERLDHPSNTRIKRLQTSFSGRNHSGVIQLRYKSSRKIMERTHSFFNNEDIAATLALLIGPFLATAGFLKLFLGRWWVPSHGQASSRTPSASLPSPSPSNPKPQIPTIILNVTSIVEILAGIALLYPFLRFLAAVVLLAMIAYLEVENRRRGVEGLGWGLRIPAVVVTMGLVAILLSESRFRRVVEEIWVESGKWEMKMWAGLEGREVGFDF